jgi:hypothetical protein
MATGAVDDEIADTEGFRDLRERFLDRLDEHVPAKWLRAVAGLFDDVAREVAEQA